MKALSLRQPWAHFVLHHGKRIENRRWNTSFRGTFLIHAAKGMTRIERDDAYEMLYDVCGLLPDHLTSPDLLRGGIVGYARVVDVIPPCKPTSLFHEPCAHRWHMGGQFGFVLEDVRPLRFAPCRGALGFFDVPDEIERMAIDGYTTGLSRETERSIDALLNQRTEALFR